MDIPVIRKQLATMTVQPNMPDYEKACASFTWDGVRHEMSGLPGGMGLNIAHEAVDRHVDGPLQKRVAIRCLGRDGRIVDLTYGGLRERSNRFANLLRSLGVAPGERVFFLAGRISSLYPVLFGTLKNRSVFCPLLSESGPEPIRQRLERGGARVLITTERLYRKLVAPSLNRVPELGHVLLSDTENHLDARVLSLPRLMEDASASFTIPPTDPEDMAILHFTSGATGMPKGVVHVHDAVLAHHATGRYILDLHPEDIFWCTADPGRVTGTSYGLIAPMLHGITSIVDEADFDPERWRRILREQRVTVWCATPAAIRMLMAAPSEERRRDMPSSLRLAHSVGEQLTPEAVLWGERVLGLPIHDNWWQTETGCIMIANYAAMDICPGSMGRPLPGIEAAIVTRLDTGLLRFEEDGVRGELALKRGWPSMFRAYLHDDHRYAGCFAGEWYLTGDLAKRDNDGYYWFIGRGGDIRDSGS